MFERILVPLDGSALAECVLSHVVAMSRAFGSEVILVRVLEQPASGRPDLSVDPVQWHLERAESSAYLNAIAARLNDAGLSVSAEVLEGRPADRIVEFAQSSQVELVVLSSHGSGGLTDWAVSSTTQKVVSRCGSSGMIVRASRPVVDAVSGIRYARLMVPLDGSWRAESALPAATILSQHHGARLILARVIIAPEMARRTPITGDDARLIGEVTESNRREAAAYLEQLCARMPFETQARILTGESVAGALHDLVRQDDIDLVVMSAHGYTGRADWPFGGTANHLIAYGAAPTLIVQDLPLKPFAAMAHITADTPREAPVHAAPSDG